MTNTKEIPDSVKRFMDYLIQNELIEEPDAMRACEKLAHVDRRIGQIALLEGFLSPDEINKIMWAQRDAENRKFGDIAIELGIMSPDEVRKALELQHDELFHYCQALITDELITPMTLYAILKSFLEENLDQRIESKFELIRREKHAHISKSIRNTLKKITVIAPMPGTVARLLRMLDDPDVPLDEVAKVISLDVGLTAMLLRLANSAFYGMRSRINTVHMAVSVIGIKKLRQLILSAALMDNFRNLARDRIMEFWVRSLRTAEWSKELARLAHKMEIDEYFLAGFLRNVGQLVIEQHFVPDAKRIERLIAEGKPRAAAEIEVLGCDHSDIGSFLLSLWKLPPASVQAAMCHAYPFQKIRQMRNLSHEAKIVNMASALVDSMDDDLDAYERSERMEEIFETYGDWLNLPVLADNIPGIESRVERNVTALTEHLDK